MRVMTHTCAGQLLLGLRLTRQKSFLMYPKPAATSHPSSAFEVWLFFNTAHFGVLGQLVTVSIPAVLSRGRGSYELAFSLEYTVSSKSAEATEQERPHLKTKVK